MANTSWSGRRRAFPAAQRQRILKRDPTCKCAGCPECDGRCQRRSVIADHILNYAECLRRGVNPDTDDNGQGMCTECHDRKTYTEQRAGRARLKPSRRAPKHPSDV